MFKCQQIMYAKYYELTCFVKNAPRQSWRVCLIGYSVKIRVSFGVRFERRKVDKKANKNKN